MHNRPATRHATAHSTARPARGDALFFALVPLAAHLAFSWIGFNPTDDGFVLAYARRLLDGQVPHRDFISIRPVGSPLLHLPELLLAGDFVLSASRFVWWCELALVGWIWVGLLATLLGVALDAKERLALRLLVVMLSAHVAPPRAWHTVDGIALASLGIWLAAGGRPWRKTVGYLVVGAAGLCKQNFFAVVPCVLIALGDWRRPRHWLAVVTPGALYVLVVTALGGGPDLVVQLGAQRDLVARGLVPYASSRMMLGMTMGALVGWLPRLARRRGSGVPPQWTLLATGLVLLAPLGLLTTAISGSYAHYARVSAFVLFGVALGRASALLADRNVEATRAAFLVLTLAWASSVSVGYATPAYASGILAALILLVDYPAVPESRARRWMPLACVTAVTAVAFVAARTQVVYREQPAAHLDRPLGDVFAGGAGIRTNPRTHAFLADLNLAVDFARARTQPYAILPDLPGHWATSRQPNPLPIDWPQSIELHTPVLAERVMRSLEEQRGRGLVLVQKVRADLLATAMVPLTGDGIYPIVAAIRATRTKIGETAFFEIYE